MRTSLDLLVSEDLGEVLGGPMATGWEGVRGGMLPTSFPLLPHGPHRIWPLSGARAKGGTPSPGGACSSHQGSTLPGGSPAVCPLSPHRPSLPAEGLGGQVLGGRSLFPGGGREAVVLQPFQWQDPRSQGWGRRILVFLASRPWGWGWGWRDAASQPAPSLSAPMPHIWSPAGHHIVVTSD